MRGLDGGSIIRGGKNSVQHVRGNTIEKSRLEGAFHVNDTQRYQWPHFQLLGWRVLARYWKQISERWSRIWSIRSYLKFGHFRHVTALEIHHQPACLEISQLRLTTLDNSANVPKAQPVQACFCFQPVYLPLIRPVQAGNFSRQFCQYIS